MTIRNMREAEAALLPYVPLVAHFEGKGTNLERIQPLMELLGNPQDRLRVVHVAGTSGKTSTAYYLAALLATTGRKVGLTVSPHVDSLTERVQINGQPLGEAVFCAELGGFLDLVKRAALPPSYFELLYAFAIWVFERQAVDYAVIETGMGGLFDATNVTRRPDKVCVITDIGFDHTHILGKTLPEIAAQKIGIVHKNNEVFMYRQAAAIMEVIKRWTSDHAAPLHLIDEVSESTMTNDGMPEYQRRNWQLAQSVYTFLRQRDGLPRLSAEALGRTQQIQIPGRMDIRHITGKTLVMDGAHNAQKMTAFTASFQQLFPDVKPAILIALKTGKEYEEVVELLAPLAGRVITTVFNTSQDLPAVSMDPEILAEAFRAAGTINTRSITDQHAAYQALLDGPETVAIITGSFYLLSQIRNND